jgi:protein TonB
MEGTMKTELHTPERSAVPRSRTVNASKPPEHALSDAVPETLEQRPPDPVHKSPSPKSPILKSIVPRKKQGAEWHGKHRITLELSLIVALVAVLGLVRAPLQFDKEFVIAVAEQEVVEMEEITQTTQIEKPPPPPAPPVPVEVPNSAEIESDVTFNFDASFDINEPLASLPPPPPPNEDEEENAAEEAEAEIFVAVEEMPELIGGLEALTANIRYPDVARLAGLEGRVIVQFIIDEKGRVSNPMVIRGQGGGLDEEALRVVREARFKPGKQRGKPVKVRMSIPINFRLREVK